MRRKRRRPNAIHYNLLLRAVRDCNVGSEDYVKELLLPPPPSVSRRKIRFSSVMECRDSVSGSVPVRNNVHSSEPVSC